MYNGVSSREWVLECFLRPLEPPRYETPLPGLLLRVAEAVSVLDQVATRFPRDELAGRFVPLRSIFRNSEPANSDAILSLGQEVYFMVEGGPGSVYRAFAGDVVRYFGERKPWETYDYYIFSLDLSQCVCFSHDEEWTLHGAGAGS